MTWPGPAILSYRLKMTGPRLSRRYTWLVTGSRIIEGVLAGALIAFCPHPYDVVLLVVVLTLLGSAIWYMRPRRCEVCGDWGTVPDRKDPSIPYPSPRAWWDLRPQKTSNFRWVCWRDYMKESGGYLPELRSVQRPGPGGVEGPADPGRPADQ